MLLLNYLVLCFVLKKPFKGHLWWYMPRIPATQEGEIRGSRSKASQEKTARTHLSKQAGHGGSYCNPSYIGGLGRRIKVRGQNGQNAQDSI
jgi:hypothetical protein